MRMSSVTTRGVLTEAQQALVAVQHVDIEIVADGPSDGSSLCGSYTAACAPLSKTYALSARYLAPEIATDFLAPTDAPSRLYVVGRASNW